MTKNLRETIFRESVRLWAEKGYENVSMRDIAAACNIGTGNLTYYFPKKDDILMFYHDKVMDYAEDITFQNCTLTPAKEHTLKHTKNIIWNGKPLE